MRDNILEVLTQCDDDNSEYCDCCEILCEKEQLEDVNGDMICLDCMTEVAVIDD